ncbi:hypothetical protein BC567DRAFT_218436 [Phyllosticta citribraziliensis]
MTDCATAANEEQVLNREGRSSASQKTAASTGRRASTTRNSPELLRPRLLRLVLRMRLGMGRLLLLLRLAGRRRRVHGRRRRNLKKARFLQAAHGRLDDDVLFAHGLLDDQAVQVDAAPLATRGDEDFALFFRLERAQQPQLALHHQVRVVAHQDVDGLLAHASLRPPSSSFKPPTETCTPGPAEQRGRWPRRVPVGAVAVGIDPGRRVREQTGHWPLEIARHGVESRRRSAPIALVDRGQLGLLVLAGRSHDDAWVLGFPEWWLRGPAARAGTGRCGLAGLGAVEAGSQRQLLDAARGLFERRRRPSCSFFGRGLSVGWQRVAACSLLGGGLVFFER